MGEKLGKITKVGKDYFEISNADVSKQDGLYFNGNGCLVNKVEGKKIYPNKMDGIAVGLEVYRNFDSKFEKQLESSKIKRQIGVKFSFKNGILTVTDEDENSVNFTLDSCEKAKILKNERKFYYTTEKTGDSDFYVEAIEISEGIPFMPISQINEIRRTILEKLMNERLKNYKRELQKPLKYVKFPKETLDYKANIHNQCAKEFYENCGCEVCEMSAESGALPKELMRTKHCLKFAFNMCKSPKNYFLLMRKGRSIL